MGGVEGRGEAARRQGPGPWRARHLDQLCRAPGADRRADLPLRRHCRPRAGHRRQRLRLWHLRRLRQARPRHLVQEAAGDGGWRGDCVTAAVGPALGMDHLWFRAKSYGWGWTPASVEGWLVLGLFMVGASMSPF